jgi:hypothetical protein
MTVRPSRHVENPAPAIAGCTGKEAFLTWTAAQKAVKRKNAVQRCRGEDTIPLYVYRCRHCGQHHIAGPA